MQVPEVMQTGMGERVGAGPLVAGFYGLVHEGCHGVGVRRLAPARGEDVAFDDAAPGVSQTLLLDGLEF